MSTRDTSRRHTNSGASTTTQSDTLSITDPLRRKKKREEKTKEEKLVSLWKRVDGKLKYKNLREKIHVDTELAYWYCQNSALPSSVESLRLYIIAWKYQDACTAKSLKLKAFLKCYF